MSRERVIAIVGATSSGKTSLGIKLARLFDGEIISADSRQVFRGMDIGTGKDLADYSSGGKPVKYHLIDVVSPKTEFSLAKYLKLAKKAISEVISDHKLPILVGGTGLYAQALLDGFSLSAVRPDLKKREELEKFTPEEIIAKIAAINPLFAAKINQSDSKNRRRLARYLEILENGGEKKKRMAASSYDALVIGIDCSDDILKERIVRRLQDRLAGGMIEEVKRLHSDGVSWKRLASFGLEYKFVSWYLLGKIDYTDMEEKLATAIYRFAKRQKTWYRRWEKQGRKIHWVNNEKEAKQLVRLFLSGSDVN
jgi:tRNA dimethylallyltransferase